MGLMRDTMGLMKAVAAVFLLCLTTAQAQVRFSIESNTLLAGDTAKGLYIGEWISEKPAEDHPLEGKYVVLEFWATWCKPCVAAIPHLNELHDEFASEDIAFVSISNEKREVVERFFAKHDMKSFVVLDNEKQVTHKVFGVNVIPRTFIVGPDLVVRWTGHPTRLTSELLQKIVSE